MKPIQTLLAAALVAVSLGAVAHGDEGHMKKHAAGPLNTEQTAWGIAGDAKAVQRTIEIAMTDNMRFSRESIEVRQSETVRLIVKNSGQVFHELVIGTRKALEEHAALMARFPGMEHDEPYMAHVGPGKSAEIVWTFNKPGEFEFACLIADHYQAGMVGKITVSSTISKEDGNESHKH